MWLCLGVGAGAGAGGREVHLCGAPSGLLLPWFCEWTEGPLGGGGGGVAYPNRGDGPPMVQRFSSGRPDSQKAGMTIGGATHARSTRQTGHSKRRPECTRSRRVQSRTNAVACPACPRRRSGVQETEAAFPVLSPKSDAASGGIAQPEACRQRNRTDCAPLPWVGREP